MFVCVGAPSAACQMGLALRTSNYNVCIAAQLLSFLGKWAILGRRNCVPARFVLDIPYGTDL